MADDKMIVFRADDGRDAFEEMGIPNGSRTWKEADLCGALGYSEGSSFRKAINRAMQACLSLSIATEENFILVDGSYKFTRFACYLIAMNADAKKPEVAAAQVYFATLASTFQSALEHADGIERIAVRDEMTHGMKALSSTASRHGVVNFAFFQNAGYRGMYNMNLTQLSKAKGLPEGEVLLNRMGRAELAGNLFRVTQTEERIKSKGLQGQVQLEGAAEMVGREVRKMMIENTGTRPESIPLAAPISEVKKAIKQTNKNLKALDGKKPKKKLPPAR